MKTGKGNQKREMEVEVQGRTFMVEFECPANEFVSPAEFHPALEEVISMGVNIRAGSLKGVSKNNLKQTFSFREVSTDEQIDQYHAGQTIKQFMEGMDTIGDQELIDGVSEAFADTFRDLRVGKLTADQAVSIMNDAIALARQKKHQEQQQQFFDIAKKWADKPNHNVVEVAHGVAYDTYRIAHPEQPEFMAQQSYGSRFNTEYAEAIKTRTVRAAKELFDS